ncbi:hypothetical protein MRX96_047054 [Rhipicephalus microplus]
MSGAGVHASRRTERPDRRLDSGQRERGSGRAPHTREPGDTGDDSRQADTASKQISRARHSLRAARDEAALSIEEFNGRIRKRATRRAQNDRAMKTKVLKARERVEQ